jgi:hypothetical protein
VRYRARVVTRAATVVLAGLGAALLLYLALWPIPIREALGRVRAP